MGSRIQEAFRNDRARFLAYLGDDLRETRGVADVLLPTYFEQVKTFPLLLPEAEGAKAPEVDDAERETGTADAAAPAGDVAAA